MENLICMISRSLLKSHLFNIFQQNRCCFRQFRPVVTFHTSSRVRTDRSRETKSKSDTAVTGDNSQTNVSHSGAGTDHSAHKNISSSELICASDERTTEIMRKYMLAWPNFISEYEEQSLFEEVEVYMKRLRYEFEHWDDAIHGYRETEKSQWNETNGAVLQRLRDKALPEGAPQISFVHVLDLAKDGYIKPHIDSTRFCGSTIAGISLLSPCVMRLVHNKDKTSWADVFLNNRSLYIMSGPVRYEYTHAILKDEDSVFKGNKVARDRRISIICRTEPKDNKETES